METIVDVNKCPFRKYCLTYMKDDAPCKINKECTKLYKLSYYYALSQLPDDRIIPINLVVGKNHPDYKVYEKLMKTRKDICNIVDEGLNIYICSEKYGNGKTSWAISLMQRYINSVWHLKSLDDCPALFINVSNYFLSLKASIGKESEYINTVNKYIYTADMVVFDDIGTKSLTAFEYEHLFNIINSRMEHKKTCIYTSNITKDKAKLVFDGRLESRVCKNSEYFPFYGDDCRGVLV